MTLIDGKAIAKTIYAETAARVARLPFVPVFCDVLVGDDPASRQYVNMKARIAESVGITFLHATFSESISEQDLLEEIFRINHTPHLSGLIVQLPLPAQFNVRRVLDAIALAVDVDCLHSKNLERFYTGSVSLVPPTPAAVMAVLDSVLDTKVSHTCVVVGQGELVGRPVTYLLKQRGMQVTNITEATLHPDELASQADILISGVGIPGLVTGSWIQPGAIVIDAGTAENQGSIVGDVDKATVQPIASFLSPTPGGVGPVTVAKLLENVVTVAERQIQV